MISKQEFVVHMASKRSPEAIMGIWTAMGISLGVALGAAFDNVGAGIAIGVALGAGIGAALFQRAKNADREDDS